MFLPFLPLILASMALSLLILPALPEQAFLVLDWPAALLLLLLSSLLLGQWDTRSGHGWQRAIPRLLVAILWAVLNWTTRLPAQLTSIGEGLHLEQASVVYGLVLLYWLADGLASHPWRPGGEKWPKTLQTLRLQLPLVLISGLHLLISQGMQLGSVLWSDSMQVLFELGLSGLILLVAAPWIVVLSWGSLPVPVEVQNQVEAELAANQTSVQRICSWPEHITKTATAGVIGILPWARFLLISPPLLQHLTTEELRAVVAHEAGHLKRKHLLFYALGFLGFVELLFLVLFGMELTQWFAGVEVPEWVQGLLVLGLLGLFLRVGIGFLSRNFERQADCNAFLRCGWHPFALALTKVGNLNRIPMQEDNWHHYGILQRLQFLQQCQTEPERVARHDQRVRRIQWGCILLFVLLLSGSLYSTSEQARESLIFLRLNQLVAERSPEDAAFLIQAANTFLQQENVDRAEELYRQVLDLEPSNPLALNNLAWLLTQHFSREPDKVEESVRLAEQAVALRSAAFIWDTLAEAYSLQGRWAEATAASQSALQLAETQTPENDPQGLRYYQERMERFQQTRL